MKKEITILKRFFKYRDILFYFLKIKDLFFYDSKNVSGPVRLQVEPLNYCNLKCDFCVLSHEQRNPKKMSLDNFKKIIDEANPKDLSIVGVGESLLHPQIIDMIRYAKSKDIFTRITTNALCLTEKLARGIVDSNLDQLGISADTTDEKLYKDIRKADYNKMISNLRYLYDYKNKNNSNLNVMARLNYNEKNIYNLPNDVKELDKLPYDTVTFAWILDLYNESHQKSFKEEYLDIIKNAKKEAVLIKRKDIVKSLDIFENDFYRFNEKKKICYAPLYEPQVTVEGFLLPCCPSLMKTFVEKVIIGNVFEENFMTLWRNEKAVNLRKNIIENRDQYFLCQGCDLNENKVFQVIHKIACRCNK